MKSFHHIGLIADKPQPNEGYFEALKVWATNPDDSPVNRIEWVRMEADSPLAGTPVEKMPHVCWTVDDLDAAIEGKNVVAGPVNAMENIRIAYFLEDGALIEYLEAK